MTSHAVADELYTEDYAMVRDAYRVGKGNSTVRGECERQVGRLRWTAEYSSGPEAPSARKDNFCRRLTTSSRPLVNDHVD